MEDNNIQRPKKVLSEKKIAAMAKMKEGREAWLKEKARCKAEGLPPPISKKKAAQKVAQEVSINPSLNGFAEDEVEVEDASKMLTAPRVEVEVPKGREKRPTKKKQVVVNNYYEEVVEEEESEEEESSSEEEEEIINNHYQRYSNNPNPQYRLNNNQKVIRFV